MVIAIAVVVAVVLILVAVGAAYYYKTKKKDKGTKVAPVNASKGERAAFGASAAAGAASGGGATLTASQMDILGPLSGILTALPAAAPPPLNMCLMPLTSALAELGLAVRQVRFNKEAAEMLQRRGTEACRRDRSRPSLGP